MAALKRWPCLQWVLLALGMASGGPAAAGAASSLEGDEAANDLLGLAAPDAELLAGADREGQAGVPHRAGLTDGDGLGLELGAVGEERVVVGRDHVPAGGLVAPAANLGHAARPSSWELACPARAALEALGAGRE